MDINYVWEFGWFINLPIEYKLLWFYVNYCCSKVGCFKPLFYKNNDNIDLNKALEYFNFEKEVFRVLEDGSWICVNGSKQRFKRPSAEEVSVYARSIDFALVGQDFIDFYDSKGWMIGKNPMKDWKAAVRTWKRMNERRYNNDRGTTIPRSNETFKQSKSNII